MHIFKSGSQRVSSLLKLNLELAAKEADGEKIIPPGLPAFVEQPKEFISQDCVKAP